VFPLTLGQFFIAIEFTIASARLLQESFLRSILAVIFHKAVSFASFLSLSNIVVFVVSNPNESVFSPAECVR
jgi:hypothetical protein